MPASNYAVRLRMPYEGLRQTISDWAARATHVVAYEHPELNNIHCHILLMGVYDTVNTLKNDMKKHGIGLAGAGKLSFKATFKSPDKQKIPITDESSPQFITYMSKGKYIPKYFTGYDEQFIESRKSLWITYKHHTADELLYESYLKAIQTHEKLLGSEMDIQKLKQIAISIALEKYKVINLGCRRDITMLLTTYTYVKLQCSVKTVHLPFEHVFK